MFTTQLSNDNIGLSCCCDDATKNFVNNSNTFEATKAPYNVLRTHTHTRNQNWNSFLIKSEIITWLFTPFKSMAHCIFNARFYLCSHSRVHAATKPNNAATFCGENCPFYNCTPIKTFWFAKLAVSFAIFGHISSASFVPKFPLIYFRCDTNCLHEVGVVT